MNWREPIRGWLKIWGFDLGKLSLLINGFSGFKVTMHDPLLVGRRQTTRNLNRGNQSACALRFPTRSC
jgi:hypothetical protein